MSIILRNQINANFACINSESTVSFEYNCTCTGNAVFISSNVVVTFKNYCTVLGKAKTVCGVCVDINAREGQLACSVCPFIAGTAHITRSLCNIESF